MGKKSKRFSWRILLGGCGRVQDLPTTRPDKHRISKQTSRLSFSDFSSSASPEDLSRSFVGSNLYIFTLAELKCVTGRFSSGNFVGEGGFGPVYKGWVDEKLRKGLEGQQVAVKVLDLAGLQGHKEWLAEVIFLGQLRHPHLVKLIGYCYEEEHRLLVYEFMEKGSLEDHLFKQILTPLPWKTRMKIALGAAKGLNFLHDSEQQVIYRDFKASNVLLDSDYNVKLSDFGLAKDGPKGDDTHVTTRVMGTQGYAAPEYIMTGHLTAKSDVYSFGVVLLELLTGRRSVDKMRPGREQNLIEWGKPYLMDTQKFDRIMDPALEGQYSVTGARKAAEVARQCLSHRQKSRPSMSWVVKELEALQDPDDMAEPAPPVERDGRREDEARKAELVREEKAQHHRPHRQARHRKQGHRNRRARLSPMSTSYSDTALYRNSPRHRKEVQ